MSPAPLTDNEGLLPSPTVKVLSADVDFPSLSVAVTFTLQVAPNVPHCLAAFHTLAVYNPVPTWQFANEA